MRDRRAYRMKTTIPRDMRQLRRGVRHIRRSAKRGGASVGHLFEERLGTYNGPGALEIKLAAVRGFRYSQRTRGGRIEPSTPGTMLLRLEPDAISRMAPRLAAGNVLVSATNGKTTTAAMVANICTRAGFVPVHNRVGPNLANGVATELAAASRIGGRIKGDIGVFEIDELWLERLAPQLRPNAIVLGNLFRDQLDRYGELDAVAERWDTVVAQLQATCRLVACADDPRVAGVAARRAGVGPDVVGLDPQQHPPAPAPEGSSRGRERSPSGRCPGPR
jgi:hypothetical protein